MGTHCGVVRHITGRDGNPSLTGRLLSQRARDGELLKSIVFTKAGDDFMVTVTIWIGFRGHHGIILCTFTVFSYMLGHDREII